MSAQGSLISGDFDVRAYIASYKEGGLHISRLLHIIDHSPDVEVQTTAARLALSALKNSQRVERYRTVSKALARLTGEGTDDAWVERTQREAGQALTRLEQAFGQAKLTMVNTRQTVMDLGDHYSQRGNLLSAMKFYMKMRDFCRKPEEMLEMCLLVVGVGIENEAWTVVNQHCARAEQLLQGRDKRALGKVRIAQALPLLQFKKYKVAALKLLDVPAELGDGYSEVLSAGDIGTFACLLALATFERKQLKECFIDTTPFRAYLDLVPELTDALKRFYTSDYSCLQLLEKMKGRLRLDMVLSPHIEGLYLQIWERALKQYTTPYLSIDLSRMATAFDAPDVVTMEKIVAKLIVNGQISARIDSENKVLYARRGNTRQATFDKALATGRQVALDSDDLLRRMSMIETGFEYRHPRELKERASGGGGGDPMTT